MVLLTVTPAVRAAIQLCEADVVTEPWLSQLHDLVDGDAISHNRLIDISRLTAKQSGGAPSLRSSLDHLLQGTYVYSMPSRPKPTPTPEYEALMTRLRAEEEQRIYERMTYTSPKKETYSQIFPGAGKAFVSPSRDLDDQNAPAITSRDIDRQLTLIINILVSIIASGIAIFIIARHWPAPQRLALSLVGSLVIAIAEVVIYNSYLRHVDSAKTNEVKKKEVREVTDSWTVQGSSKGHNVTGVDGAAVRHRKGKHR